MAPRDAEGPDEHVQGNHFTGHDIEAQRVEMGSHTWGHTADSQPAVWYCGVAGAVVLLSDHLVHAWHFTQLIVISASTLIRKMRKGRLREVR